MSYCTVFFTCKLRKETEEESTTELKLKASLNEQLLISQIFLRYSTIPVDSSSFAFLEFIFVFESTATAHKVLG